jgi:hypothetical protein
LPTFFCQHRFFSLFTHLRSLVPDERSPGAGRGRGGQATRVGRARLVSLPTVFEPRLASLFRRPVAAVPARRAFRGCDRYPLSPSGRRASLAPRGGGPHPSPGATPPPTKRNRFHFFPRGNRASPGSRLSPKHLSFAQ